MHFYCDRLQMPRDLRWQAQDGFNVAMATPSVVLCLPPCPRNFRSISRQSHSRAVS